MGVQVDTPLEDILRNEKHLISIVSTMKSEKMLEIAFKIYSAKKILSEFKQGSNISLEELIICLEDFPVPFADTQIVQMIKSIGVLEPIGEGLYRIASSISLSKLLGEVCEIENLCISIEDYKKSLDIFGFKKTGQKSQLVGLDQCIVSMQNTLNWAFEIISNCINQGMRGMPVFWKCEGGRHTAIGDIPGSFAAVDSALLILEPIHYGFFPVLEMSGKTETLARFIDLILSFQSREGDWNSGGFCVEKDDDFPESQVPTVDTTANTILLLLLLPRFNQCLISKGCKPIKTVDDIQISINSGVDFLLKMQLQTGGWGIYRYEGDKFNLPPRDYSSTLALSALSLAKSNPHIVEEDILEPLQSAIHKYASFIQLVANRKEDALFFWSSNLSKDAQEKRESLYATTRVAKGLIDLTVASPQYQKELEELLNGAVRYIIEQWEPNPENQARMEFRVPTKEGPHETFMHWEPPADPIIASTLLEYSTRLNHKLDSETIRKIDTCVLHIVNSQTHGHWADLLLQQAKAFPSNTHYFHRATLAYLEYTLKNLSDISVQ